MLLNLFNKQKRIFNSFIPIKKKYHIDSIMQSCYSVIPFSIIVFLIHANAFFMISEYCLSV
jgi:hypothetical protein